MKKKGFTLIELMVVIMIVGILAAVAIPIMRGRIDSAKWSEGKSAAGSIATALRAYAAEKGPDLDAEDLYGDDMDLATLGFRDGDLEGTFFSSTDYTVNAAYPDDATGLTFTIAVSNAALSPTQIELDQDGNWTETEIDGG